MKCYPIQNDFISMFYNREKVLLNLLKKESIQMDVFVERIDICDFSLRCLRFFNSPEYELKNNTIVYTNEITQEKSFCTLQNNAMILSSMEGFSSFIERYFKYCYIVNDDFSSGKWFFFAKK